MMGVLIVGFVILFMAMKERDNNQDALVASGFITAVLSIFFVTLNFISTQFMILIVVLFAIGFLFVMLRKQ